MRKYLTVAIEVISIVTAIGVVLSAFVYSVQFSRIGISYMAVASLADMLRDSIKLLILFVIASVGSTAPLLFTTLANFTRKTMLTRIILSFVTTAALVGLSMIITAAAAIVGGVPQEPVFKGIDTFTLILLLVITTTTFFLSTFGPASNVINDEGKEKFLRERSPRRNTMIGIIVLVVVAYPTYSTFRIIGQQLEGGLLMSVEVDEGKVCDGKYATIWMGDNKAVVRCEPSKKHVVKVIK